MVSEMIYNVSSGTLNATILLYYYSNHLDQFVWINKVLLSMQQFVSSPVGSCAATVTN